MQKRFSRQAVQLFAALVMVLASFGLFQVVKPNGAHADSGITISEFPIPTANSQPRTIVAGSDGNLWFAEANTNKIGRITSQGTITEFALPGTAQFFGSFFNVITLGPGGNIWFTSSGGLGYITPSGSITMLGVYGGGSDASITLGPDGNIWSADWNYGAIILRITPSGVETSFQEGQDSSARYITSGSDGNLWNSVDNSGVIGRITPQGVATEFGLGTDGVTNQLTSGPDGNVWFTEWDSFIGRITPAGVVTRFPVPSLQLYEDGITSGPDGNLWFTESDYHQNTGVSNIGRITPSGTITEFPLSLNSSPFGITKGPDGNMWFTEPGSNKIGRVNLGSPTPPTRNKLVVMVQGIGSQLLDTSGNGGYGDDPSFDPIETSLKATVDANGNYPFANAQFMVYSYAGERNIDQPALYDCNRTYSQDVNSDILQLAGEIDGYTANHPNTDVYIISHSLGGVIALGYVASLVEDNHSLTLEKGGKLVGVDTNDSPLGGVVNNNALFTVGIWWRIHINCNPLHIGAHMYDDMQRLYSETRFSIRGNSTQRGMDASVYYSILHFVGGQHTGVYISNQNVAYDAANMGLRLVFVGNVFDLLWRADICHVGPDFHSTENLGELGQEAKNGSLYSRTFQSGSDSILECVKLPFDAGHHLDVLYSTDVARLIWEVFTGNKIDKLSPVTIQKKGGPIINPIGLPHRRTPVQTRHTHR